MTEYNKSSISRYILTKSMNLKSFNIETINNLIKHETNSLLLSFINLILSIVIWILISQIGFQKLGSFFQFLIDERYELVNYAYILSWIIISVCILMLFREFYFPIIVENTERNNKKIYLTVNKKYEELDENSDEDLRSEKRNLGDNWFERFYSKITYVLILIILEISHMYFYLPYREGFLSIIIGQDGNTALITGSDYYSFSIVIITFLIVKIFVIILNIFCDSTRRMLLLKEKLKRIEESGFNLLDKNALKENNFDIDEIGNNEKSKILSLDKSSVYMSKKENMNLFNTPIDVLKKQKMQEIEYKKKLAYLKEREKLLEMIEEEKLKDIYGKNYKKYKKEKQKIKNPKEHASIKIVKDKKKDTKKIKEKNKGKKQHDFDFR